MGVSVGQCPEELLRRSGLGLGDLGKVGKHGLAQVRKWDNFIIGWSNNLYLGGCGKNRAGLELYLINTPHICQEKELFGHFHSLLGVLVSVWWCCLTLPPPQNDLV